ncbi:hypothetical protein SAMN04488127_2822 [Bhargavaea ginsengi]|uniref:Uncharacterized protein n=1 Tax=Bhargavaea ginsengi TaxID=426757 RepID=A0A1H7BQF0_9BACL|nr:hypothetical protein [Bhargavaea ginsengi]SEJ79426.1 hypothetical protein SAMN04488127_2822 [Bhargavaea ginsengi]
MYIKSRIKQLLPVVLAMAATFMAIGLLMEDPDYTTAILAIAIGLVIGEIIHYLGAKKERPEP